MMERKLKDSGIPWIGLIPEYWETSRAKEMFNHESREVRPEDGVITCFRDGEVTLRTNRRTEGFTEAIQECGYQGIRKGDLVIHQMDAFAGAIGVSDSDGKGSPVLVCLTPNGPYSNQYYSLILRVMASQGWIKALYKGIRERSTDFRYDTFSQQLLPVPPLEEQERITAWLDAKCGEIDELIEIEQQMITALESYKKSKIREAVFGLDKSRELKDSKIEWIGNIPIMWTTRKIKFILTERKEKSKEGTEEPLTMSQKKGLVPTREYGDVVNPALSFIGAKIVCPNDLVFNKLKAHLGVFSHSKYSGLVSPDYAVYYSNNSEVRYYEYLFKTEPYILEFKKKITGVGSGLSRLYTSDLFSIDGLFPPLTEQQEIADYLDKKCAEIDDLIKVKQEKIETLKLYRQSMIFEAVTGKTPIE